MTPNRFKGVHNVDLSEMFLLGFENRNCLFGSQEPPGSAVGLGPVIFILYYWCVNAMCLSVLFSRGNTSEVSESNRVNFKPCWCLFGTVNDKEMQVMTQLCRYLIHDGSRKTRKETCRCFHVRIVSVLLRSKFSSVSTD